MSQKDASVTEDLTRRARVLRDRLGLTRLKFFTPNLEPLALRLGIAITLGVIGVLVVANNTRDLAIDRQLTLLLPVVLLAAWLGRGLAGLAAAAVIGLASCSFLFPSSQSFHLTHPEDSQAIVAFFGMSAVLSLLVEALYAGKRYGLWLAGERRHVVGTLLRERERLGSLLANLPGLVWELELTPEAWPPRVHFVSANSWRLTGYTAEEWLESDLLWEQMLSSDEASAFAAALRTAIERGSWNHRHLWRSKDGRRLSFETHVAVTSALDDGRREIRCVSVDVSDREGAERALAQVERRFRETADRTPLLIWMASPAGGNTWCNQAWLTFRGRTLAEELQDGWRKDLHPEDEERINAQVRTAFETSEEFHSEFRIRRFDGEWRWILSHGVPRFGPDGELQDYLGLCVDINDRKQLDLAREDLLQQTERARAEAELAARAKDEFLARVSHELRNPLNGILGWTQILNTPEASDEEMRRGVELIDASARALTRLVDDLLDLSRIVAGKMRLSLSLVSLGPAVDAACNSARPGAAAKGLELDCHIEDDLPRVMGDAQRLQQVVWNLLSNAIKFTSRGGKVDLSAKRAGSSILIEVRDTGIGIAPHLLSSLFVSFWQADTSASRMHQGLGLGLSIARHLVEQHGGTLSVVSEGVGRGSAFSIHLPVAPLERDQPHEAHPKQPASLGGIRVLVVDDDRVTREMLRATLSRFGAVVDEAASTAEALVRLSESVPQVMVCDIEMPEADGYTLMRRVRALSEQQGGSTPAIALTAYAQASDRRAALLAGFQEHLAKPINTEIFLATIRRLAMR